jgi:hypothetical protein
MSVMDLSGAVLDFATGTYNVTRAGGPGTYVAGVFTPAATSTVSVIASVQPMTGRDLQRLPDGLRAMELLVVFSVDELKVAAPGVRPDVLAIDDATWQVETVERFNVLGNYYRSIVSKIPEST